MRKVKNRSLRICRPTRRWRFDSSSRRSPSLDCRSDRGYTSSSWQTRGGPREIGALFFSPAPGRIHYPPRGGWHLPRGRKIDIVSALNQRHSLRGASPMGQYKKIKVPTSGHKIELKNGKLVVPNDPI